MLLKDKVCVVTGGARGIGRATFELLAKEGGKVHACDLSFGKNFEANGVEKHILDVTDYTSWEQVVNAILLQESRIDVLFNNAGTVH